jgi:hypothetical protein
MGARVGDRRRTLENAMDLRSEPTYWKDRVKALGVEIDALGARAERLLKDSREADMVDVEAITALQFICDLLTDASNEANEG